MRETAEGPIARELDRVASREVVDFAAYIGWVEKIERPAANCSFGVRASRAGGPLRQAGDFGERAGRRLERPVEPLGRPRAGVHVIGWRAGEAISPAVRAIMPKTGGKK